MSYVIEATDPSSGDRAYVGAIALHPTLGIQWIPEEIRSSAFPFAAEQAAREVARALAADIDGHTFRVLSLDEPRGHADADLLARAARSAAKRLDGPAHFAMQMLANEIERLVQVKP